MVGHCYWYHPRCSRGLKWESNQDKNHNYQAKAAVERHSRWQINNIIIKKMHIGDSHQLKFINSHIQDTVCALSNLGVP